jgi:peptidyl-prolyl cis-trans isomerase B (cyclophilin B)
MTIDTSCGPIKVALEAAKAPHTVNLLSFLAAGHFYDGTKCHRSTNVPELTVLQCGDPTGTGSGEIGFTIAEENLKGATYPRGTLAMAKTSAPHSTGSQFFLVDKDSQLPPQYTVAGHIMSGLPVLDQLIAVGNNSQNGQGDGAPNKTIYLQKVTVTQS